MKTPHTLLLARLANELQSMQGVYRLQDAFSTDKSQLFLQFKADSFEDIVIRLRFDGAINGIQFSKEVYTDHPRRMDQFSQLYQSRLKSIYAVPGERSLIFSFEAGNINLLFHGSFANAIASEKGEIISSLRKIHQQDKQWVATLEEYETFQWPQDFKQAKTFGFYRGALAQELERAEIAFPSFEAYLNAWITAPLLLCKAENEYLLELDVVGDCLETYTDAKEALSEWSELRLAFYYFKRSKSNLLKEIHTEISSREKRLKALEIEEKKIQQQKNYRHLGDLIMAHLPDYQAGAKEMRVVDYLDQSNRIIPLKKDLNAQENATRYYRKAKNQHLQEERISSQKKELEESLFYHLEQLSQVEASETLAELRPFLKQKIKEEKTEKRSAFHAFEYLGFSILVGKQAKDNDELSLKIAKKDDLWLHARDVSGSHVIIRKKAGQNFPDKVIETAAGLALWFSKRKTESLAPVIYTEKKFIRKRKGDPAGAVVVDKEKVVMAAPLAPDQIGKEI